MTVRPPSYVQAGSFTGDDDRLLLASLLGASPNQALSSGIVSLADYKVTQTGTPSMNLQIASGSAWVVGSQSATEGVYNVVNDDNTATVTIATANATNPRIDLVVLQIRNSEYSGANNDAILTVVTGTPAASPAVPVAPADSLVLAQIAVAANATSIVTANITDKRPLWVANLYAAGHLASNKALTTVAATLLTLPSLTTGVWEITFSGYLQPSGVGDAVVAQLVAGTATATFEGTVVTEGDTKGTYGFRCIATITASGTLIVQARNVTGTGNVLATSGSYALANATGFVARRIS